MHLLKISLFVIFSLVKSNAWPTFDRQMIAYDCNSTNPASLKIPLTEFSNCSDLKHIKSTMSIQLLQLPYEQYVDVIQCKVIVKQTIYLCDNPFGLMRSFPSRTKFFLSKISRDNCHQLHEKGHYEFDLGMKVYGNLQEPTVIFDIIAGKKYNNTCNGTRFVDSSNYSWKNVVVEQNITVTLSKFSTRILLDEETIEFPDNIKYDFSRGKHIDNNGFFSYWNTTFDNKCKLNEMYIVFDGLAEKVKREEIKWDTVFKINFGEKNFSIPITKKVDICGKRMWKTKDPRWMIYEDKSFSDFGRHLSSNEITLNRKYIHNEIVNDEYFLNYMISVCKRNRKSFLNNLMDLGSTDKIVENALNVHSYSQIFVDNNIVNIIPCVETQVILRHTRTCYKETPVYTYKKGPVFLDQRSKIIQQKGNVVDCGNRQKIEIKKLMEDKTSLSNVIEYAKNFGFVIMALQGIFIILYLMKKTMQFGIRALTSKFRNTNSEADETEERKIGLIRSIKNSVVSLFVNVKNEEGDNTTEKKKENVLLDPDYNVI